MTEVMPAKSKSVTSGSSRGGCRKRRLGGEPCGRRAPHEMRVRAGQARRAGAAGAGRQRPLPARGQPTIFVMCKEPGFDADYWNLRNGEWEYVAYRPDRSIATPPTGTFSCAACHLDAGQGRDWVFRTNLFLNKGSGAIPKMPTEEA